ncbi:hypothetical protein NMG60_11022488 [Bertholletia excelsa]
MDKGWGLTLDTDPVGFFQNKRSGMSLTPTLGHNRTAMFPVLEFPVSLNRKEDQAAALLPSDGNRAAEVDFFSASSRSSDRDSDSKTSVRVKQEDLPRPDLNTGLHLVTANAGSDQSTVEDGVSSEPEKKRAKNEVALLKAELERMNGENQRLRGMLSQVNSNYGALQVQLMTIMQQQQTSKAESQVAEGRSEETEGRVVLPRQFIELGPAATTETEEPSNSSSEERTQSGQPSEKKNEMFQVADKTNSRESPESQNWVPNKVSQLNSSKSVDQATEATMRKARVSVRARSEAPLISDGCQWRKYGQKMAKGNPCPRAYYRCTMAVGCPVRKQVQRCAEDRTILITTYEGTHNHPLPPAAVAMASTTSAAANMLLSGSMSSADGLMNPNFLARAILPSSSTMATISASAPFPTVTLDLTHHTANPNPNTPQLHSPATPFAVPLAAAQPPAQIFGQPLYNQSKFSGLHMSQPQQAPPQPPPRPPQFNQTLSAATAAFTADPNFTAALAAAISSIIGGAQPGNTTGDSSGTTSNGGLPGN